MAASNGQSSLGPGAAPDSTTPSSMTAPVLVTDERARWIPGAVGGVAFALALAVLVVHLIVVAPAMIDLQVYRWGGALALDGADLYDAVFNGHLVFTYPPISAALFTVLAAAPLEVLRVVSVVVAVAAVLLVSWLTLRDHARAGAAVGGAVALTAAISLFLEPVQETIFFGQINLVLLVLVVWDLSLPSASRWKGVGIGLAAGLKLTPALFIVYLVVSGRLVPAARAAGVAGLTVLAGFVVLPAPSVSYWLGAEVLDSGRVGGEAYVANQSVRAVLLRWAPDAAPPLLWWMAAAAVLVVGLVVATRFARRGHDVAGGTVCALTGLLISPVSWSHHWVWVVPALGLLVAWAVRCRAAWLLVAVLVTLFVAVGPFPGWIWLVPHAGDQELAWGVGQALVGNLYVVVGVLVLAVLATLPVLRQRARPTREVAAPEVSHGSELP